MTSATAPPGPEEIQALYSFYGRLCSLVEAQKCSDKQSLMVLHKVREGGAQGMGVGGDFTGHSSRSACRVWGGSGARDAGQGGRGSTLPQGNIPYMAMQCSGNLPFPGWKRQQLFLRSALHTLHPTPRYPSSSGPLAARVGRLPGPTPPVRDDGGSGHLHPGTCAQWQ